MVEDYRFYLSWSEEDDQTLAELMASRGARRTTYEKIYVEAAEKLNRTVPSVKTRWQKIKNAYRKG